MTSAKQPDRQRDNCGNQAQRVIAIPSSITDFAGWVRFFQQLTYMRYLAVSVAALAVDLGLFLLLLHSGLFSMASSAIGYSVGIGVHWFLSSRTVFQNRVSDRGSAARTQQKAMFAMSAVLGLATTTAIVGGGEWLGLDPRIAKLVAIAIAFQITYWLRNILIFRAARTV
jgi:putative flippase GtrA